jgi:hypothetical protein
MKSRTPDRAPATRPMSGQSQLEAGVGIDVKEPNGEEPTHLRIDRRAVTPTEIALVTGSVLSAGAAE